MCFSAESSFTVAGLLGVTTYAIATQIKSKRQYFLAAIPAVLGFMQLLEGIVWSLSGGEGLFSSLIAKMSGALYLFLAGFFWPIWVPLSFFMIEKNPLRHRILKLILAGGVIFDLALLIFTFSVPIVFQVFPFQTSLRYQLTPIPIDPLFNLSFYILYLALLVFPYFVSSLAFSWIPGIIIIITFIATQLLYNYAFDSVWCFFSTIATALIYVILYKHNRKNQRKS